MGFEQIVGQKELISIINNSIKNEKVGHAYIFTGSRGIGKRTLSKEFSKILLCNSMKELDECEVCKACELFKNGTNPDFKLIEAEGASISVENIRKLQSDIILRPMYSKRKVYLILDAEKMTVQAQNCLLKTLEEPPSYAAIILTCSNYDSLLTTIRSRTIRMNFRKNTIIEVKEYLNKVSAKENSDIDFIAAYADGIIGTALLLSSSTEFITIRNKTLLLIRELKKSKPLYIYEAQSFFEEYKEDLDLILDIMLLFYRDIMAFKATTNENILINSDKKDIILGDAHSYSYEKIIKNIYEIENTKRNLKYNANYQLAIEVMLMKLQEECA